MELGGKRVDLKKITMSVLNFYGKFDHLVPPEACDKLISAVGSKDTEDICLETGHIGIYVSSKCQKLFAPKIVEWLFEKSRKKAAPKKKAVASGKQVAAKKSTTGSRKTTAKKNTTAKIKAAAKPTKKSATGKKATQK